MAQLVILYGPPCSGKTMYFHKELEPKGYIRISPSELFRSSDISVHKVVSRIVKHLNDGENVVLDDSSVVQIERSRITYLEAIKAQFSSCRILLISINPNGGVLQCKWANEFACAENAIPIDKNNKTVGAFLHQECNLDDWILHSKEPSRSEGYSEMREISWSLKTKSNDRFRNEGLIVEFKSIWDISTDGKTVTAIESAKSVLQDWIRSHERGRVIVLIDESNDFPANLELLRAEPLKQKKKIDDVRDRVMRFFHQMELGFPLYYIRIDYDSLESKHFFKFPNPGCVAFLQYRHKLNLKDCCYVYSPDSVKSESLSISVGFRHISSEDFFKDNKWTSDSKIRKFSKDNSIHFPKWLEAMDYVGSKKRNEDDLPLENQWKSMGMSSEFLVEERAGSGRVHGCIFSQSELPKKDELLDIPDPIVLKPIRRRLPEWMSDTYIAPVVPKTKRKNTNGDDNEDSQPKTVRKRVKKEKQSSDEEPKVKIKKEPPNSIKSKAKSQPKVIEKRHMEDDISSDEEPLRKGKPIPNEEEFDSRPIPKSTYDPDEEWDL